MLTEDFTNEIERLSKGNWKGVHRAGRGPWLRRSALAAIGAAALAIFPLTLDAVERSQFTGPVVSNALGTVPDNVVPSRNDPPPRIVEPVVPDAPAKPTAVSIPAFVPIKRPPSTGDSSVPVPDRVVPPPVALPPIPPLPVALPRPIPIPPPITPPPVALPEEPLPPPTIPPLPIVEDSHHHRHHCHCKKCKAPDLKETNGREQDQQEPPEANDQHESTGETAPVVDSGTGAKQAAAGSKSAAA